MYFSVRTDTSNVSAGDNAEAPRIHHAGLPRRTWFSRRLWPAAFQVWIGGGPLAEPRHEFFPELSPILLCRVVGILG